MYNMIKDELTKTNITNSSNVTVITRDYIDNIGSDYVYSNARDIIRSYIDSKMNKR